MEKRVKTPGGLTLLVPDDFPPEQMAQMALDADEKAAAKPAPPNANAAVGGLATDMANFVSQKWKQYISDPADAVANTIRAGQSGAAIPTADDLVRRGVAGTMNVAAHPKDNAPMLGAIAGDLAGASLSGGASLPMTIARRAVGTGLGQMLGGVVKTGDTAEAGKDFLLGAGTAGAVNTGVAGLGYLLEKLGRGAALNVLGMSDSDLVKLWNAETGSPVGYTRERAQKLAKDLVFDKGPGRVGSDRYFQHLENKTNADETAMQGIRSQTRVEPVGTAWKPGDSVEANQLRSELSMPRPQFDYDLNRATRDVSGLRRRLGGPGGGDNPLQTAQNIDDTVTNFFNRPEDTRVRVAPLNRQLPEAKYNLDLPETPINTTRIASVAKPAPRYENRDALLGPPVPPHPHTSTWNYDGPATMQDQAAQQVGFPQATLAPRSVLEGPDAFTGTSRATPTLPSQRTVGVPDAARKELGLPPAPVAPAASVELPRKALEQARTTLTQELTDGKIDPALAKEILARIDETLGTGAVAPNRRVGFDTGLDIIGNLDDKLVSEFQNIPNATSKSADYVPSPQAKTWMNIRGTMRNDLNAMAPTGELGGQPISLADLLDTYSKDIQWRNIAAQATGSQAHGVRTATGVNRTGLPYARLNSTLDGLQGFVARPFARTGQAAQKVAPNTSLISHILYTLAQQGK